MAIFRHENTVDRGIMGGLWLGSGRGNSGPSDTQGSRENENFTEPRGRRPPEGRDRPAHRRRDPRRGIRHPRSRESTGRADFI